MIGEVATFLMCGGTHLALLACWVAIVVEFVTRCMNYMCVSGFSIVRLKCVGELEVV